MVIWKPTRSIDVKFKAESTITQAVDTDATGIRADALQVGIDYEFRRNVVLSLQAIYEKDRFVGLFREDKVYAVLSEVRYLLDRHWSISVRHQYTTATAIFRPPFTTNMRSDSMLQHSSDNTQVIAHPFAELAPPAAADFTASMCARFLRILRRHVKLIATTTTVLIILALCLWQW